MIVYIVSMGNDYIKFSANVIAPSKRKPIPSSFELQ